MRKNKTDIDLEEERLGLFYNNDSFDLDVEYGRHYLDIDVNSIIKLYQINIIESKTHSLYGQSRAKDKKYLPPVKITGRVSNIGNSVQENYGGDNGLVRDDSGNIEVCFFIDELNELGIDFNRGDIIEYNLSGNKPRYYEIQNANNVIDTTSNTIGGFKPIFRKVIGIPVKTDVVNLQ